MADGFYRLTYRDIADRLGISPDAARMKANRKAKAGLWRLLPDETPGQERLVEIPSADLDGIMAKAAPAEHSAPVEQAERSASVEQGEQAKAAQPTERPAPVEPLQGAEQSVAVEPYVPSRVSISFEQQHRHMPAATTEPAASPERPAFPETVEHPAAAAPVGTGEQPTPAERIEMAAQAEQPAPAAPIATPEPPVQPEQPVEAEQSAPAEAAATGERGDGQSEPRSGDDDLDESAEAESGDVLVSTLTARVATLTNRLLEETNAREKERQELVASEVRERELKVEIERLCTRISELNAALEGAGRPWWRRLIQGRSGDN